MTKQRNGCKRGGKTDGKRGGKTDSKRMGKTDGMRGGKTGSNSITARLYTMNLNTKCKSCHTHEDDTDGLPPTTKNGQTT